VLRAKSTTTLVLCRGTRHNTTPLSINGLDPEAVETVRVEGREGREGREKGAYDTPRRDGCSWGGVGVRATGVGSSTEDMALCVGVFR